MSGRAFATAVIARLLARRHSAAPRRPNSIGDIMSIHTVTTPSSPHGRAWQRVAARVTAFLAALAAAFVPLLGFTTTAARACACGCSVFDIGGGLLPQENDSGGRIFTEWWHSDQNQNYVGSSKGPANVNSDKRLYTDWVTLGAQYMFNREWGVMARLPYANRNLTTDTGAPGGIQTFNSHDFGDLEVMGMYTGFFNDMSTGVMFGLKLPTGVYNASGIDRDSQIGTGSTDLILGGFHRGMLSGDNAWQYFSQIRYQQPFLYRSAVDPQGAFDGNQGVVQTYKPGYQVDGAAGIVYNNLYNVLGFDKITPLFQLIASHRDHDRGDGSDPLNSGFDRLMVSPGVEFTKVLDEPNNRVFKFYVDVEVTTYYRANAANNAGTEGQLVSPWLLKMVTSYNF
jgi:hypothetical protein